MKPESDESSLFGTDVADIQDGLSVVRNVISGKLKYLDEGAIASNWGDGYFMALSLADNDFTDFTSVKVGLEPSVSSGLVEIINDPDKNGVFKVTDKYTQKFVVVATDGTTTSKQKYDLSNLIFVE